MWGRCYNGLSRTAKQKGRSRFKRKATRLPFSSGWELGCSTFGVCCISGGCTTFDGKRSKSVLWSLKKGILLVWYLASASDRCTAKGWYMWNLMSAELRRKDARGLEFACQIPLHYWHEVRALCLTLPFSRRSSSIRLLGMCPAVHKVPSVLFV